MSSITTVLPSQPTDLVDHLSELRAMLEEQRRFRLDQLTQLATQQSLGDSRVDSLDVGADIARVEVSAAVEAAARQALDDIEAALARMDSGSYGACARCAAPIPVERLLAIPQAPLCMRCQERAEHFR